MPLFSWLPPLARWAGALPVFLPFAAPRELLQSQALRFENRTHQVGSFVLEWAGTGWNTASLRIRHPDSPTTCWESVPGQPFLFAAEGREDVSERHGMFRVGERLLARTFVQTVEALEASPDALILCGTLRGDGWEVPYEMSFRAAGHRTLRFAGRVEHPRANRLFLRFATDPGERFFGFGEQFTYFDVRGRKLPVWVSEQGIGRGLQPLTWLLDLVAGSGGSWHTTYAPVPHFVSSRLRSLALDNSEYAEFDLQAAERAEIEVFATEMRGHIYAGHTPLDLIREHSAVAGRMRALPDWIHAGAVVGMQGGTERVRSVWGQLERLGVPIAAFWLQDWVGRRVTAFGKQLWWNWELDREHYPMWEELLSELHAKGIRVLTYVNPFLVDVSGQKPHRRNLFQEARERGFLVRRADGEPYLLQVTTFPAGLLDLTNPEARRWMIGVLQENVLGAGASGWMADFGEGLPYDAVLASGDPKAFHNLYPVEWARLNREAIEASGRGEDAVFFTRAGFTQSPRFSTLFWLGDQLVSWDHYDGMRSAIVGLLSSGLSGFAFQHGDIGGYTTINVPLLRYRRSPELLFRWMELGAFQVVFRTHEGNLPEANHQFYSNEQSLTHFRGCARLHAAWYEYRKRLIREAAESGAPVCRHLFLHYPDDPRTWELTYEEFLVGPDLLVAPVSEAGATSVPVYLPAGRWVHLWSGAVHDGPLDLDVAAPLGQPAVFYRAGSQVGEEMTAALDLPQPAPGHRRAPGEISARD